MTSITIYIIERSDSDIADGWWITWTVILTSLVRWWWFILTLLSYNAILVALKWSLRYQWWGFLLGIYIIWWFISFYLRIIKNTWAIYRFFNLKHLLYIQILFKHQFVSLLFNKYLLIFTLTQLANYFIRLLYLSL